jgi:hypothetical protein
MHIIIMEVAEEDIIMVVVVVNMVHQEVPEA